MRDWSRRPQVPHKNWVGWAGSRRHCSCCAIVASSSLSVRQGWRRSFQRHVFYFHIVFAAITATFLAVIDQSNSCMLIGRFGLIAVVRWLYGLQYIWLSNSQGKVATLIKWGGLFYVSTGSFTSSSWYSLQKNYDCIFKLVKVVPKVLPVPFSRTQCSYNMPVC